MISRFVQLKSQALQLRKRGMSIGSIETGLGIPRSTLSGWFKNVKLTKTQKAKLEKNWRQALVLARKEAVKWHNAQKIARLNKAEIDAEYFISKIDNIEHGAKIALAFLYLGEGTKKSDTSMGSSDPMILRFFINCLNTLYQVPADAMRCELHLRSDQSPYAMKKYWSKALGIPIQNFLNVSLDKRTLGKPTYNHYKGVCLVRCGRVAIQRELLYIAKGFCRTIQT